MFQNIPIELRQIPHWSCAGHDKTPINPKTGQYASVSDPTSWSTFEEAVAFGTKHNLRIGFMLSANDRYTIIDLDDKEENPAAEEEKNRHQKIIEAFDSYTERSTSGRGFHIVIKGNIPTGARRGKVECYSDKRFMIFTGDVVRNTAIADRQDMLNDLYAEMKPSTNQTTATLQQLPPISDTEILTKMKDTSIGQKSALWSGDWEALGHSSQSEADFEFGILIAHFTSDEDQWKRLFTQSCLGKTLNRKSNPDYYLKQTFENSRERAADEGIRGSIEHGRIVAAAILANNQSAEPQLATEEFSLPIPKLRPEALYGILNEIAVAGSRHSEAVPAALAINTLIRFCATVGRVPYLCIGDDLRSLRPYALIIGPTSKGRKGTSAQLPSKIYKQVDSMLGYPLKYETAMSSGEGLYS